MIIKSLIYTDVLWKSVSKYAHNCSWGAGKYLAKQMQENDFSDWERVFVAIDNDNIVISQQKYQ
ncbi:hypothetical protein [Clostridium oryzae]|uniref:Uncharacterized protein n=1 Tax=Clostridium oryzae TaxID=1450648 RepID=A0A1V4IKU6_9CLOT|nr:hypothetical protein [Clostridium oryzae]OPJ60556.1 hypothetical protein CLORY_27320 [Clostridium oryzae]